MTDSIDRTSSHASANACTDGRISCLVLVLLNHVVAISAFS